MRRKGFAMVAGLIFVLVVVAVSTDGFGGAIWRWLLSLHGVHEH